MAQAATAFALGALHGRVFLDGQDSGTAESAAAKYPAHVEAMRAELGDAPVRQSRNILLLEDAISGERHLFDTGEGRFHAREPGALLDALQSGGVAFESITTVILSHFHLDHMGGLLDANGARTFPNARIVAARPEIEYWMQPDFLASTQPHRAEWLRAVFAQYERVDVIDGAAQIAPGVTLLPAYGHTPGHLAALIESGGERLLHVADSWHLPAQINVPHAVSKYDMQPENAVAARRALLDRAEGEGLLTFGYHFPFPGMGYVRREGERRTWQPIAISE